VLLVALMVVGGIMFVLSERQHAITEARLDRLEGEDEDEK
jgi:hypothetical protein